MKLILLFLSLLLFLNSCSSQKEAPLKVSINSWIGYSPIMYAYDKGWLKPYNIEVINVVSLAESLYLYTANNADAFTGTQYEFALAKESKNDLLPIMMFDQSYGGDMVMANRTLSQLTKTNSSIETYLEMNSINSLILKDFLKAYRINKNRIHYINKDQEAILALLSTPKKAPSLVVTYAPYNISIRQSGFKTIVSTRDGSTIKVIDALYATRTTLKLHKKQFSALKKETNRALEVLQNNPKEYYKHVKKYLQNISYADFQAMRYDVKWINKTFPPKLRASLEEDGFNTQELCK